MKTLLLVIPLVSALSVTGQRSHCSPNMRSYIIGSQKDSLEADFILPSADVMPLGDTLWLQDKIIIADGDQSAELFPDQLSGVYYNGHYYETLWWEQDTLATPRVITRKFCKRILEGAVAVFTCNEVMPDKKGYRVRAGLYYKQDGQYKPASLFNFQCAISRHKSQHEDLAEKVKSGNFRRDEFLALVQEYIKYLEPKTSH